MVMEARPPIGLSRETIRQLLTPPRPSSFQFVIDQVRNHKGEPFNHLDYPWTEGICDAWDDPDVRSIALQFAARVGKTQLAQSLIIASIAHDPVTWMYGNATEGLVKETVRDKYYPMFERCPSTRPWVPIKTKRIQTRIDLAPCRGYTGWSGSPTSLADKDPKYLHAGEIDKWSKNVSSEADPLSLFLERGLEIPDRKVLLESTPAISHQSRIEAKLKSGWDCRFHVPCPKCGQRYPLIWGDGFDRNGKCEGGGIIFDKNADGRLDPQVAFLTARYLCHKCRKEWDENEKREVVQNGIWVPNGQWLTKSGKFRGTMLNPGPDASYQLSRLYAPTFSFGSVAREFVLAELGSEEKMRNWRNSWMGWTWSPLIISKPWEEVAETLCVENELHVVPRGGYFLTAAVDVQDDHWVYMVCAWGADQKGWVIDYGICHSWEEVSKIIQSSYPHADSGPRLKPMMTLIDARDGNRKDEVIYYCRGLNKEKGPFVWPCMGSSSTTRSSNPYTKTIIDDANRKITKTNNKKKHSDFGWINVNTGWFQQWMHNCLYRRTPGNRMSLAFPKSAVKDRDLFEQLINETPSISLDSTGHDRLLWMVVKPDVPVDFRDTARYNRCGAEVYLRGNWSRIPEARRIESPEISEERENLSKRETKPRTPAVKKVPRRWVRGLPSSRLKGLKR